MSIYFKKRYGNKYLKFEVFLNEKIREAEAGLERERGNLGENEVTHLIVVSTLREILNKFLEIKNKDFRYKKLEELGTK